VPTPRPLQQKAGIPSTEAWYLRDPPMMAFPSIARNDLIQTIAF
jgi:hypothetical protein